MENGNDKKSIRSSAAACDASQDIGLNPSTEPAIGTVIAARLSRRQILRGLAGATALSTAASPLAMLGNPAQAMTGSSQAAFTEIKHGTDATHHVAPGYSVEVLIRWGDPVLPGAVAFNPMVQTPDSQAAQFGFNCDYVAFLPLPADSGRGERGLLCVNHEYTFADIMFPGLGDKDAGRSPLGHNSEDGVNTEIAAHGCSVIEIAKNAAGKWQVQHQSPLNRRITGDTPMHISGPAAGHPRLRTNADPSGTEVLGTLNNCAGGETPWQTYLTAEENFHGYFNGSRDGHPEAESFARYGVPGKWYGWDKFHDRFDINKEPNEANRFGWIVEIDPMDPHSVPIKRTALGRFKHEGATSIVNKDGRVVVYSGDDERFEYVYRFVSDGRFDPDNRDANRDLLDSGTLSTARFDADGTVNWLPLVFGTDGLTPENKFHSQSDVLIETRRAADIVGATPMDRPEEIEPNPVTGKVYLMLTNNTKRTAGKVNAANPRATNAFGHIIEITPDDGDHGSATGRWDILVKCGDPAKPGIGALWNAGTSENGWFACPDNCAVDGRGRLWIATDQGSTSLKTGTADGFWSLATDGEERGTGRMFFRAPEGAEVAGPCFTPDDRALFLAIQHPATDGVKHPKNPASLSTFEDPATGWPDFQDGMPPRPSIIVITKNDGGLIG